MNTELTYDPRVYPRYTPDRTEGSDTQNHVPSSTISQQPQEGASARVQYKRLNKHTKWSKTHHGILLSLKKEGNSHNATMQKKPGNIMLNETQSALYSYRF
jgi:hypothetical protein